MSRTSIESSLDSRSNVSLWCGYNDISSVRMLPLHVPMLLLTLLAVAVLLLLLLVIVHLRPDIYIPKKKIINTMIVLFLI